MHPPAVNADVFFVTRNSHLLPCGLTVQLTMNIFYFMSLGILIGVSNTVPAAASPRETLVCMAGWIQSGSGGGDCDDAISDSFSVRRFRDDHLDDQLVRIAREEGVATIEEGFAERAYTPPGKQVPRSQPDALLDNDAGACVQAIRMVRERSMESSAAEILVSIMVNTLRRNC